MRIVTSPGILKTRIYCSTDHVVSLDVTSPVESELNTFHRPQWILWSCFVNLDFVSIHRVTSVRSILNRRRERERRRVFAVNSLFLFFLHAMLLALVPVLTGGEECSWTAQWKKQYNFNKTIIPQIVVVFSQSEAATRSRAPDGGRTRHPRQTRYIFIFIYIYCTI